MSSHLTWVRAIGTVAQFANVPAGGVPLIICSAKGASINPLTRNARGYARNRILRVAPRFPSNLPASQDVTDVFAPPLQRFIPVD